MSYNADASISDSSAHNERLDKTTVGPFLTVFIPTAQGREIYLENCLARLSFQDRKNFEVIAISDGPMPQFRSITERFLGKFPLDSREGKTQVRAWGHPQTEEALHDMRGRWFVRVNDDNIVYPNFAATIEDSATSEACSVLIWRIYVANRGPHHGLIFPTQLPPVPGGIDMFNFAVARPLALQVGFPFRSFASDWEFLSACLSTGQSSYTFIPVILGEHW